MKNVPELVAHRGFYKTRYPENSISAFRAALEVGAPIIEFDVQMTSDHELVIHHDKTFERTAGIEGKVSDTTFAECMKISVHEPDKYRDEFYPETMPSLQDVLTLLDDYSEAKCLLEIKTSSMEKFGTSIYFEKLLPYLNEYGERIIVISFSQTAIEFVHDNTDCKTAWIFKEWSDETKKVASDLSPDILMCKSKLIPENDPLWDGFDFMIYGVPDPDMALHYGSQGVKYIEVDDVERFYKNEELASRATSHRVEKESNSDIQEFISKIQEGLHEEDFTCNAQQFASIVGVKLKMVTDWIRREKMPASPQGRGFCIDLEEAIQWCLDNNKFTLDGAGEAVSLSQEKLKQQLINLKLKGERDELAVQSAQIKLLAERERYVDIELVQEHVSASMKDVVASFRALGQQLALKLVTVTDRNKIQDIMDQRIEEILEDLKKKLSDG